MNLPRNNRRQNPGLRAVSLLTALVFTWNTVSWANPAALAPSKPQENVAALINGIHIPENIGKIESKYLPQDISEKSPVFFHIQDAHAHPEAQKNIQAILEHLASNNGVKNVVIESAFGEINPEFLSFSSKASINDSLIQYLTGVGEITGSELFARQSREAGIALYGVEDPKLYDESFKIFQTVKFQKEEIRSGLNQYRRALERLESDYFTEDLKEFVYEKRLWEENRENALGYFKILKEFSLKNLKIDFMDPAAQFNWPQLTHLLNAEEIEKRLNRETAFMEMDHLSEALKRELPMERDRDLLIQGLGMLAKDSGQRDFQVWLRGNPYRPEVSAIRHFFEVLYARASARDISLLQYPNFLTMAGLLILHEEIDSAALFKEVSTLEGALEKRLAKNGTQKRIFQLGSDFSFMQRLLSLQLTREDYDAYLKRKADFSAKKFQTRFKHFFKTQEELPLLKEDLIRQSARFYELSRLRDEALLKNAMRHARPAKESATAFIAGGFHSEGLSELLREKKIPHVIISPKMTAVESDDLYEQVMMGKHADLEGFLARPDQLGQLLLQSRAARSPVQVRNLLVRGLIEGVLKNAARSGQNPQELISEANEILSSRPDFEGVRIIRDSKGSLKVAFSEKTGEAPRISAPSAPAQVLVPAEAQQANPLFGMLASAAFGGISAIGSRIAARASRSELRMIPVPLQYLNPGEEIPVLRHVLSELQKERQSAGSSSLPAVVTISDQHGAIKRFDQLILDAIRQAVPDNQIPENFAIDPVLSLDEQLTPYGITLESLKGKIFFHNIGDFMDRGPFGIRVFRRSRELVAAGISDFIAGNHDLLVLKSVMGFHLPFYEGFQFYGYSDDYDGSHGTVQELVKKFHETNPSEALNKLWWARHLKEYEEFHMNQQKTTWAGIEKEGEQLYNAIKNQLTPEELIVWRKFRGVNKSEVLIHTGVRSVGLVSVKWWQELLREFKAVYGIKGTADSEWGTAITMMENEIIPKLKEQLEERLSPAKGEWWVRVFEAINSQNYTSAEWYSKDWAYHEGWGTSVFKELNAGVSDPTQMVTQANYLEHPVLKEVVAFYRQNFNLFIRDIYQNSYLHSVLPVNEAGEFYFTYKGIEYRGKGSREYPSVWDGLGIVSAAIRNPFAEIQDLQDAFSLLISIYADNTTKTKPSDIAKTVNQFGVKKFAKMNGYNRLFTGHNPIDGFHKLGKERLGPIRGAIVEDTLIFTDHSMSPSYGGRGASVIANPAGIQGEEQMLYGLALRGYQNTYTDLPMTNPNTLNSAEELLFENSAIPRGQFLDLVEKNIQNRLAELEGDALPFEEGLAKPKSELRTQKFTAQIAVDALNQFEGQIQKESQGLRAVYSFRLDQAVYSFVSLPRDGWISVRRERLGEQPSNQIEIKRSAASDDYETVLRLLDEKSRARSELRQIERVNPTANPEPRIVLFDFDGTLSDTFQLQYQVFGRLYHWIVSADANPNPSNEELKPGQDFLDRTNGVLASIQIRMMIEEAMARGVKQDQLREILKTLSDFYEVREKVAPLLSPEKGVDGLVLGFSNLLEAFLLKGVEVNPPQPLPGAVEFINTLHDAGIQLYVGTGTVQSLAEKVLRSWGVREKFQDVYGTVVDGTSPFPRGKADMLEKVRARSSLSKNQVIIFGDGLADMQATWFRGDKEQGKNRKKFIAVGLTKNSEESKGKLIESGADFIIPNLEAWESYWQPLGFPARSELRVNQTREEYLADAADRYIDRWIANKGRGVPTLIGFSGPESGGKSEISLEVRERIKTRLSERGLTGLVRKIPMDRWFLDRHRRIAADDVRGKFLNKWAYSAASDAEDGSSTPFNLHDAMKSLARGNEIFAPLFYNPAKQRLRISSTVKFTNPATQNIDDPQKARALNQQIQEDVEFLEKYLTEPDQQILAVNGRKIIRLYNAEGQWYFKEPELIEDAVRMAKIKTHVSSMTQIFADDEHPDHKRKRIFVDTVNGDLLEQIHPDEGIILIEGVTAFMPEVVPQPEETFAQSVWVGLGDQSVEGAETSEINQRLRTLRYLNRRIAEGRIQTNSASIIRTFLRRHTQEYPLIAEAGEKAQVRVNSISQKEMDNLKKFENTIPVVIAFDMGGGSVALSHETLALSSDGIDLKPQNKLTEKGRIFSEKTRSREGPNGTGKNIVLGQLALLIIERVRRLQTENPGKNIFPIVAIGAPGNTEHPNFEGRVAPHSADNLATDFDDSNPELELQELVRKLSGLDVQVVWNNDSLAQGYAAIDQLLPNHPELEGKTALFLSLGTGLGMGIVKVGENGDKSTIGDSHIFDLDFTDRFPLVPHPNPQQYGTEAKYFRVETPGGPVYVEASVPGKVRAEDVVSGRAIRQILSAFERSALERVEVHGEALVSNNERPLFLMLAGLMYKKLLPDKKSQDTFISSQGISDSVHMALIQGGMEGLTSSQKVNLKNLVQPDYLQSPVNGKLINELAARKNNPELARYNDLIREWVNWVSEFLAENTHEVIKRVREGDMRKTDPSLNWPESLNRELRDLNILDVVVGSSMAKEGAVAERFQTLLQKLLEDENPEFTLREVPEESKTAGIEGALGFVTATDVLVDIVQALFRGRENFLETPSRFGTEAIDREAQREAALDRPRAAALLDIGDVLHNQNLPIPEEIKNILTALVNEGVGLGVATGKPVNQVEELLGPELSGRVFNYALNSNIIRPPQSMHSILPGFSHSFSDAERQFLENLFAQWPEYFSRARIYRDKNKLTEPSTEERSYEGEGANGSRINISAFLGRPTNPNFAYEKREDVPEGDHRQTTAFILEHLIRKAGLEGRVSADVAGRIGLDVSSANKKTALDNFTESMEQLQSPAARAALEQYEAEHGILDRGGRILKIIDMYEGGFGADAQFAGPYSYSVGEKDKNWQKIPGSQFDTKAPVMMGGGIPMTINILEQTRWVNRAGKIFRVLRDGSIVYESVPEPVSGFEYQEMDSSREAEIRENIGAIRRKNLLVNEDGEVTTASTAQTWTGWVYSPEKAAVAVQKMRAFKRENANRYQEYVVIGMGGPGNAANLLLQYHNVPSAKVLDHIDPSNLATIQGDLSKTLFIVESKSGTTSEILAMLDFVKQKLQSAGLNPLEHIAVVTDKATPLDRDDHAATSHRFINNLDQGTIGDIGGRFSIGTYFGLLPLFMASNDGEARVKEFVQSMADASKEYKQAIIPATEGESQVSPKDILGARLADVLAQARAQGRNKVTLIVPEVLASFAPWVEQLFNESLGKGSNAVVLVGGEEFSIDRSNYGKDRIFLSVNLGNKNEFKIESVNDLPLVDVSIKGANNLGYLTYHMMMATALLGLDLNIDPFNQPGVEESKKMARLSLQRRAAGETVEQIENTTPDALIENIDGAKIMIPLDEVALDEQASLEGTLASVLGKVHAGNYASVLLATSEDDEVRDAIKSIRTQIRDRLNTHPATMGGIISKDNHANLQLHAAPGYKEPAVILITFDTPEENDILLSAEALQSIGVTPEPGVKITYADLNRLIAHGEFEALAADDKEVIRIHLPVTYRENLGKVKDLFDTSLNILAEGGLARSELRGEVMTRELAEKLWAEAKTRTYRAEVADVDGNLTPVEKGDYHVSDQVIGIFKDRVLRGIPGALASVRSEKALIGLQEIQERILADVPPEKHSLFMLFPENGTYAAWNEWDAATGQFVSRREDLAQLYNKVPKGYQLQDEEREEVFRKIEQVLKRTYPGSLQYKEVKQYGFQASIVRNPDETTEAYTEKVKQITRRIRQFLKTSKDPLIHSFDVSSTRTSVLVLKKGVNKSLAIRFFATHFGLKVREIVGTDDQGDPEGNGWHLTKHSGASFSTNLYNPQSRSQIPLKLVFQGLTGVDAWLKLHENLKFEPPVSAEKTSGLRFLLQMPIAAGQYREYGNVRIDVVEEHGVVKFVSRPIQPIDYTDTWAAQQYMRDLYNALADFSRELSAGEQKYSSQAIKVEDRAFEEMAKMESYRNTINAMIQSKKGDKFFVDQLDIYRTLARLREHRLIPELPVYTVPKPVQPYKAVLLVNGERTNLDVAILRNILGNNNIGIEAIVGITPEILRTRLNSTIYGEFLTPENIDYNEEEGWIKILDRFIRVIPDVEKLSPAEWRRMGPEGVIATFDVSEEEKNKISKAFSDTDEGPEIPFVASNDLDVFVSPDIQQDYTGSTLVRGSNATIQSSLVSVPLYFYRGLTNQTVFRDAKLSLGLEFTVSPTMSQVVLDQSGKKRAASRNVIGENRAANDYVHKMILNEVNARGTGDHVGIISFRSAPVPIGDSALVRMTIQGNSARNLIRNLGLEPEVFSAPDGQGRVESAFIQNVIMPLGQTKGFSTKYPRQVVNTDARFEQDILIDYVGTKIRVQVSDGEPIISIAIPIVFNRELNDVENVLNTLEKLSRENLQPRAVVDDSRLSDYGRQVVLASANKTLPPEPLEIPERIEGLIKHPVAVAVLGPQGQIGSRVGVMQFPRSNRSKFNPLNYYILGGSGATPEAIADAVLMSSVSGPLMSNGRIISAKIETYPQAKDGILGAIIFGDGLPYYVIDRYKDPKRIPWALHGVEIVVDATGAFTKTGQLVGHLNEGRPLYDGDKPATDGAKAVLLSAPLKDPEGFPTIVYGVNENQVLDFMKKDEKPKIVSAASCTTNCMATATQYINRLPGAFEQYLKDQYQINAGISKVVLSPSLAVHAPTNSNPMLDYGEDPSVMSAFFYSSGVSKAIKQLGLEKDPWPKAFSGFSVRVSSGSTSIGHIPFILKMKPATPEDKQKMIDNMKIINTELLKVAQQEAERMAQEPRWQGYIRSAQSAEGLTSEKTVRAKEVVLDWQQAQINFRPDEELMSVSVSAFYDNVDQYTQNLAGTLDEMARALRELEEGPKVSVAAPSSGAAPEAATPAAKTEKSEPRSELRSFSAEAQGIATRWLERHQNFQPGIEHEKGDAEFLDRLETSIAVEAFQLLASRPDYKNFAADFAAHLMQLPEAPHRDVQMTEDLKPLEPLELVIGAFFAEHPEFVETGLLKNQGVKVMIPAQWTAKLGSHGTGPTTKVKFETVFKRAGYPSAIVELERVIGMGAQPTSDNVYVTFAPVRPSSAISAAGRSELREQEAYLTGELENHLEESGRSLSSVLWGIKTLTKGLVEPALLRPFSGVFRALLGYETSRLDPALMMMDKEKAGLTDQLSQSSALANEPKTIVLVPFNGKVPDLTVEDLLALNLSPGSQVIFADIRGNEAVRKKYASVISQLAAAGVRVKREVLDHEDQFKMQLQKQFLGGNIPILIFPHGTTPEVLNDYRDVAKERGFVTALPRHSKTTFALSAAMGLYSDPVSLRQQFSDDVLEIKHLDQDGGLSPVRVTNERGFIQKAFADIQKQIRAFATAA